MTGMMISMTNSMMTSIAIGTILATLILNKDLTIPTIVAVLIGMIVGYLNGRPVSLIASLDGLTAGIMGGMMGSMLGVMLQPTSINLMIYFIDIVFVLVIKKKKPLVATPFVLIALLLIMGVFVFKKEPIFTNASEQTIEDLKFTTASSQIYEIVVTPTGYSPNNLVIKAGTPSIINFKTGTLSCTGVILSDELGFNVSLKGNTNNYITLESLKPGTYHYWCSMDMFEGTITVVE
jgi:plastocyanin